MLKKRLERLKDIKNDSFHQRKTQEYIDRSNKCSIDHPIITLIERINSSKYLRTTSSCSGRMCLYSNREEKILYYTHDYIEDSLYDIITNIIVTQSTATVEEDYIVYKYEPFLLHVECENLDIASSLLKFSISLGFRNSGIIIGKKIMVNIRLSLKVDFPVVDIKNSKILVDKEYLDIIKNVTNKKIEYNFKMIKKLEEQIISFIAEYKI